MTELSPAAQAVLNAFWDNKGYIDSNDINKHLAAALRAVAQEVVLPKYQYADWEMAHLIMSELQNIAAELEGQ